MPKEILINAPGAGDRIIKLSGGSDIFRPETDHSIASYRDGKFLGGFVLNSYFGNAIAVQNAADDPTWCSRDMLKLLFGYIFLQLKCHKAYATVASSNYHALDLDFRAGWRLEYILRDAMAPGLHVMLLAMEPSYCPWIKLSLQ